MRKIPFLDLKDSMASIFSRTTFSKLSSNLGSLLESLVMIVFRELFEIARNLESPLSGFSECCMGPAPKISGA